MRHEDLREEAEDNRITLDLKVISGIAAFIVVLGVLVGAILPALLEEEYSPETTSWERRFDTYLKLSIDDVGYNSTSYLELDITTVFSMMIMGRIDTYQETLDRSYDLLSFSFPEAKSYKLTISQGNGWSGEYDPIVLHKIGGSGDGTRVSFVREVQVIGDSTGTGTLILTMELWGVS